MAVTEVGMETEASEMQESKACSPMAVTKVEMYTEVSDLHK